MAANGDIDISNTALTSERSNPNEVNQGKLNRTSRVYSDEEYTQDGSMDYYGNPAVKSKTGKWKACPFILGNECAERLAYYGMSSNMVNYLKKNLNMGNATTTRNNTNWGGTCYITPLIGAFLADSYWGRYRTIITFSIVYFIGMTLLTISASVPELKPPCKGGEADCHASTGQLGVFFLSLYLIALGTGGIKPCVSSFGADQFDEIDDVEKKKKSSFFNWFYFSINIGAMVASSVLVYTQEHAGWGVGFGIPAGAMGIAICSFILGTPLYRYQKPGGSPLTRMAQVIVASFRKWHVQVPAKKSLLYEVQDKESTIEGSRKLEHTDAFLFLDKAAVETSTEKYQDGPINPWRLCTVTQVEELKSIVRILPIWATGIIFSTVSSQMGNLFVELGDLMNAHMGPHFEIPSASLGLFDTVSVILWVPIYDRVIVPTARKFTGKPRGFTQLQRIGIGLVISIFSMVVAAIVEIKRLAVVREHNSYNEDADMSIFWQVPQYFLIGAAEVFTIIGQLEFFYDQAPDAMRSLCSALQLTTIALGSYLSSLLVTIVTRITAKHGKKGWIPEDNLNYGHVDYFFWLLTIISVLNFLLFVVIANWYTYKKPSGQVHVSK
uniref:Major facilitator superfamily (MFS) profile domain-containing protein n=1 Tax=Araucaria cunninghamii TaxID=56994 RepID=A0A0D6R4L3_ARACU